LPHYLAAILLNVVTLLGPAASAQQLTVAAAADLNYALKDVSARFEQQTGNKVALSFGASGNLYAQIQNGAPYDLFFSADSKYPGKLAEAGLIDKSSLHPYATGHLVLWLPQSLRGFANDRAATREHIAAILLRPEVKRIAIANPEHAPYGRAALTALERLGIRDKVKSKLVLGENVSQAAQFAQSGNAQAALISLSLALSPPMKRAGDYWKLPADTYPEIEQVAGIVAASRHKQAAQAFIEFVRSGEGAAILKRYGFAVPTQK
jgi:molybdate transport system substrate-binding protein